MHGHGVQRQESKPAGLWDPGGRQMVIEYWLLCFKIMLKALRPLPLYTDIALSGTTACELLAQCVMPEDQVWSKGRCHDAQLNFQPERTVIRSKYCSQKFQGGGACFEMRV